MQRPDENDRRKLVRDLAHLTKILDESVIVLEEQLEKCQRIVQSLKRKLRKEESHANGN